MAKFKIGDKVHPKSQVDQLYATMWANENGTVIDIHELPNGKCYCQVKTDDGFVFSAHESRWVLCE